jgi:hypothetical protein
MALIDDVRASLRVVSESTDAEIQMLIDAAISDMRRCGVNGRLLGDPYTVETEDGIEMHDGEMSPAVKTAVTIFAKANYGYDNSEAPRFMATYTSILAGLLNSKANEYLEG